MLISVVVATYNRLGLLLELLTDLAGQRLPAGSFEVIVVDDGSKVPVRPRILERSWPFSIQVVERPNGGQAVARHQGITHANGDIVVITDDDMALHEDFLAAHRDLHAEGYQVVLGQIRNPEDLTNKPIFERFHAAQLDRFVASMRSGDPIPGAALCTGNVSFRRDLYLKVGGFDLTLKRSEDRDLGIRFKKAGARFAFSERAYTVHRSDHSDRAVWLRRAYLYGAYDTRIGRKYAGDGYNDSFHYLAIANPIARPLLLGAALAPKPAGVVSRAVLDVAERIAKVGLERAAIKATTLVYGLEYYRGVRSEFTSTSQLLGGILDFLRKDAAFARTEPAPAQTDDTR